MKPIEILLVARDISKELVQLAARNVAHRYRSPYYPSIFEITFAEI
jgi:hypothetical protein